MTLPADYFTELYARDPDPWGFRSRWYEQRKYALSVAVLPRLRYRSGFEPGCSVGVLTAALATRCDRLLAIDPAESAVAAARSHLTDHHNVVVECARLPEEWPSGTFDLIVLSEIGYYFDPGDLSRVIELAVAALEPGGDLLAVHWRPEVADYPQTGDAVHDALRGADGLSLTVHHLEEDFVLELFRRGPGPAESVAETEGLR